VVLPGHTLDLVQHLSVLAAAEEPVDRMERAKALAAIVYKAMGILPVHCPLSAAF
jgi:hypothetical protein